MAQPVILAYDVKDVLRAPVTSTEVIVKGDLVKLKSTGYIYAVDAATNDITFVGLALDSSATAETTEVAFAFKCIAEIDATSASYRVGAGLLWTSDNTVADDAGANTLCWVAKNTTSASRIEILVDAPKLQKKFEVNA